MGSEIINNAFEPVLTAECTGPFALYFSAQWCRPCKQFTPLLKAYHAQHPDVHIVFISSDTSTVSFNEYFSGMSWYALPYEDRQRKAILSKVFDVRSIPALLLFDSAGKLVSKHGVDHVTKSLSIAQSAKPAPRVASAVHSPLTKSALVNGQLVPPSRYYCLYFSASWCGPCKRFTPLLADWYVTQRQKNIDPSVFEVLFVSADRNESDFAAYSADMPWKTIDFGDADILHQHYNISSLPTLLLVDQDGSVLSADAITLVKLDRPFPWN